MKVLVTGASGFLGSHIAEALVADGHQVRLLLRRTSNREWVRALDYEDATGDITDPASLPDAIAGVDAVIHAAGLIKARSYEEFAAVNATGTGNLLAAAEAHAPGLKRFIYVSSLAAHGPSPGGRPRPIDASPNPITAYGRSKLAGEDLVRLSTLAPRSVIFRAPAMYGPRDPALVPFFRLAKFRLAPLLMGGHNRISIAYGPDAAQAIATAAAAEANVDGKTYTMDDGEVHTWRDLLAAVEKAVGARVLPVSCPRWTFDAVARINEAFGMATNRPVTLTREKVREMAQRHWVCDSEALRRDLGWTPTTTIGAGARLTAAWYKDHGWI
jgi:nucleoside-diphosphate-sugar epimerase